eukprot:TRINITY_DN10473_c0_g1_i5.p1 TRINITY_DN10473_c0_g1~~TRINITY_DN10473_c0_g1_i5.p1  ORF type:complete len:963 (-),score=274.44 TRINITY_DN10473_c0_g1_i5:54-2942(-)
MKRGPIQDISQDKQVEREDSGAEKGASSENNDRPSNSNGNNDKKYTIVATFYGMELEQPKLSPRKDRFVEQPKKERREEPPKASSIQLKPVEGGKSMEGLPSMYPQLGHLTQPAQATTGAPTTAGLFGLNAKSAGQVQTASNVGQEKKEEVVVEPKKEGLFAGGFGTKSTGTTTGGLFGSLKTPWSSQQGGTAAEANKTEATPKEPIVLNPATKSDSSENKTQASLLLGQKKDETKPKESASTIFGEEKKPLFSLQKAVETNSKEAAPLNPATKTDSAQGKQELGSFSQAPKGDETAPKQSAFSLIGTKTELQENKIGPGLLSQNTNVSEPPKQQTSLLFGTGVGSEEKKPGGGIFSQPPKAADETAAQKPSGLSLFGLKTTSEEKKAGLSLFSQTQKAEEPASKEPASTLAATKTESTEKKPLTGLFSKAPTGPTTSLFTGFKAEPAGENKLGLIFNSSKAEEVKPKETVGLLFGNPSQQDKKSFSGLFTQNQKAEEAAPKASGLPLFGAKTTSEDKKPGASLFPNFQKGEEPKTTKESTTNLFATKSEPAEKPLFGNFQPQKGEDVKPLFATKTDSTESKQGLSLFSQAPKVEETAAPNQGGQPLFGTSSISGEKKSGGLFAQATKSDEPTPKQSGLLLWGGKSGLDEQKPISGLFGQSAKTDESKAKEPVSSIFGATTESSEKKPFTGLFSLPPKEPSSSVFGLKTESGEKKPGLGLTFPSAKTEEKGEEKPTGLGIFKNIPTGGGPFNFGSQNAAKTQSDNKSESKEGAQKTASEAAPKKSNFGGSSFFNAAPAAGSMFSSLMSKNANAESEDDEEADDPNFNPSNEEPEANPELSKVKYDYKKTTEVLSSKPVEKFKAGADPLFNKGTLNLEKIIDSGTIMLIYRDITKNIKFQGMIMKGISDPEILNNKAENIKLSCVRAQKEGESKKFQKEVCKIMFLSPKDSDQFTAELKKSLQ